MIKNIPSNGEYYVDLDEESGCWGVFHTDVYPNFCRALFTVKEEAEEYCKESNRKIL